jgi:hypothetical protein
MFVGNPLGFNNPTRQVLEEGFSEFGEKRRVSLILSLGSGRPAVLSRTPNLDDLRSLLMCVALDCERVAGELSAQLSGIKAYLRMDADQGMENIKMTAWHEAALGSIMAQADVYLHKPAIKTDIDICSKLLQEGSGEISLAELSASRPSERSTLSHLSLKDRTGVNIVAQYVCPTVPLISP